MTKMTVPRVSGRIRISLGAGIDSRGGHFGEDAIELIHVGR